jgi:ArsR family transcriptional regulator
MDIALHIDVCQYREMKKLNLVECCSPLLSETIAPSAADDLAKGFKVLGDPARLRILSLIGNQPAAEACVCDLVEPLGLKQPTVSHHLKVLHEAGLLTREKRGTWAYYRLVPETLELLRAALAAPALI